MQAKVILVDTQDQVLGTADKLYAHEQGLLHRAFSVLIYRKHASQYELLLQQRHPDKYHSGGLWSNTCCSHPMPDETILQAATRRLNEEMGIQSQLIEIGAFCYKIPVGNGLTEHEFDHVLIGEISNDIIQVNPEEVVDYRWVALNELCHSLKQNPQNYTVWLESVLAFFIKQQ